MHPAVGHLPQAVPPCVDGPRAGPALPRAARPQQGVACNGPPEPVLPLATAPGATGHLVAKPMQALRIFIVEDSPLILDNLIATLDLQRISIGGSVFWHHRDWLLPKLRAEVAGKLPALTDGCAIVPAGLGERVGDFGALALVA